MSEHEPFGFGDDGLGGHESGFGHDPFDADHGFHDDALDRGLDDGLGHDGLDQGDLAHDPYDHFTAEDHYAADHEPTDPHTDPHTEAELPESLAEHAGADHLVADDDTYPPHLDLTEVTVSPTDGQEWVDPGLLGDEHTDVALGDGATAPVASPEELLDSLHSADGSEGEPSWDAALNSDDPAVRSLAAFWHPDN
jgi:hypothetical protein